MCARGGDCLQRRLPANGPVSKTVPYVAVPGWLAPPGWSAATDGALGRLAPASATTEPASQCRTRWTVTPPSTAGDPTQTRGLRTRRLTHLSTGVEAMRTTAAQTRPKTRSGMGVGATLAGARPVNTGTSCGACACPPTIRTETGRSDLLAVNQAEHHALISDGEQFTFVKWLEGALHAVGGACAADVTGDGYADGIEFGSDFVGVVTRRGASFGNTRDDYAPWSPVGLLGTRGTFVADVDADGRADVVSLFEGQVTVARSNGDSFASAGRWLAGDFTDYLATFVADVDGDEMADVIGVRPRTIDVALSTGMSFTPATTWRDSKLVGRQGTFFADVDGDGRADGVRLELDGAWVLDLRGWGSRQRGRGSMAPWPRAGDLRRRCRRRRQG